MSPVVDKEQRRVKIIEDIDMGVILKEDDPKKEEDKEQDDKEKVDEPTS